MKQKTAKKTRETAYYLSLASLAFLLLYELQLLEIITPYFYLGTLIISFAVMIVSNRFIDEEETEEE